MSIDYIFFDAALRDRFLTSTAQRGLTATTRDDPVGGFVVSLPDGLASDVEEQIEAEYDALMEEQRELVDATDDEHARDLMGVTVTLPDGRPLMVRVPAHYGRRLVEHFDAAEIHGLVAAIVQSALNPIEGPLCRNAPASH